MSHSTGFSANLLGHLHMFRSGRLKADIIRVFVSVALLRKVEGLVGRLVVGRFEHLPSSEMGGGQSLQIRSSLMCLFPPINRNIEALQCSRHV